jgi:outer membrane receptor protein involved in Fe transport
VVENMPGVARATVGSGALVVWGAAPQDTRVYVDGVRIPALYHMGGLRSVMATDFVSGIEVVPGGYAASFGRGLGGLVSITTQSLDKPGTKGVAAVDVIDAQVGVRTDLSKSARAALFIRRSHLAEAFAAVSDRDIGDLLPLPRFWDGQGRLHFDLGEHETLTVTGLFSTDAVTRSVNTGDPAFEKRDRRELTFYRLSARYERHMGAGESVSITPWFGRDHALTENRFGAVPASLRSDTTLVGLRGTYRVRPLPFMGLAVGIDGEFERIDLQRRGSVSVPPREGDIRLFGQPPPDQVNFDDWSLITISPATFIESELDVIPQRLKILPGLRVSPFMIGSNRISPPEGDAPAIGLYKLDTSIEPRVATRLQVTENLAINAAWGRYRQPASGEDLSATFGTPSLPLSRGTHYVLGSNLKLSEFLTVDLTGFISRTDNLAMRNPLEAPALATALLPSGTGRVHGAQILLRADTGGKFFGWVSYSLLRSERKNFPEATTRLFDFDQTHILTVVGSYQLGAGFELGSRFRLSSGFPRTPVVGRAYDTRRDIYQPIFGEQNSIRLPTFAQLDVRLARRMKVSGTELELYLDVQNITNRENGEEFVFNNDFSERRTIRGLPFLPVAGARWAW